MYNFWKWYDSIDDLIKFILIFLIIFVVLQFIKIGLIILIPILASRIYYRYKYD
jgi:hypothetical protein